VKVVLTLTDRAAETIRALTTQSGYPDGTGLRMSMQSGDEGKLALSLEGPQPEDSVVEESGARVFVGPDVVRVVEDSQLDAQVDDQGRPTFMLSEQNM
jgi:Fe-S cluster assembly iron-binding protein IscA